MTIDRATALEQWRQQYIERQTLMGDGLEVYWWNGIPNFRTIVINDGNEGQSITMAPKHALILLKWLEQERATLEELAAKDE
ncbi:MAG TPA: hypothetical protein VFA10_17900 [Ktedonobacteraceae bacterium]|nr:hypothetical protein [Ktedonobacteraceae bacterium]